MPNEDVTNPTGQALAEDDVAPVNPGEGEPIDDAWEAAWFLGDYPRLEAMAAETLAQDADDVLALSWKGLAQFAQEQVQQGQQTLLTTFTLIRAQVEATDVPHEKEEWNFVGAVIANRLLDAVAPFPELSQATATWVLDGLQLEHPPSLRVLAERRAEEQGDAAGAATLIKRALTADATDAESHYAMARYLARLGKKPNVVKHLQAALKYGQGSLSVRTLARFEPDFDALRSDPEFAALIDPLPTDPVVRPLYQALDVGDLAKLLELAPAALKAAKAPLDVLYPWREAVELLLEAEGGADAEYEASLAQLDDDIAAREGKGESSDAYRRYSGD